MRPRTAGGRDAMLRSAAEAAVDAAMEQSGAQLGGMPPAAFITGLAGDLGASLLSAILVEIHASRTLRAALVRQAPEMCLQSWSPQYLITSCQVHAAGQDCAKCG